MTLEPLTTDLDIDALVPRITPSFNGDAEAARGLLALTVDHLRKVPRPDPWGSYLVCDAGRPVAVASFKAAPDPAGSVEIAYMTFPAEERKGYAGQAIGALTRLAFERGAALVIAHTLPEENASNRALKRNGFRFAGDVVDPEDGPVWRWERASQARP